MIDIIIPAYNAHKTIERALISISNQSIKDKLKVYIINDNSDSDYSTVIKKFSNIIDVTEYKLDKNHGPGYARQYGLEHSTNERILFLDSDDVFFSFSSVENLNKKMEETNCDMVFSNISEQVDDYYYLYTEDWIDIQGKLYNRHFIKKHGINFPYLYGEEDNSFNQQFYAFSPYIERIDDTTYVRVFNQDSLTRSSSNDYYSKYELYYSLGFRHTLESIIKNKAAETTIARLAFTVIVRLYNRIENVYNGNYINRKTFASLKKIIKIYDIYNCYLTEEEKKDVVNSECSPELSKYEYLMGNKTLLCDFINKYR